MSMMQKKKLFIAIGEIKNVVILRLFIYRFLIGQYVTAHGDVIAHVNITHVMVEDGGGMYLN